MKSWLLQRNSFLYLMLAAFAVMVFVEWPLLNSAYKGKEKDFNDKLFLVTPFIEESLVKDTVLVQTITSDTAAIRFVRTQLTKQIDSFFARNSIPIDYVYAVGRLQSADRRFNTRSMFTNQANLIWSSDHRQDKGLAATGLRIAHIGAKNADRYFVKIFLPAKPAFLVRQLLPLVILSGISIVLLFICFLALLSIIRRQSSLAAAKENFINNMTHELKTPLFTISIASKMLSLQEEIQKNTKLGSYIDSIREETARLTTLVDKVLETSALNARSMQLAMQPVDLHAAIRSAVKSFDLIASEQQASVKFAPGASIHEIQGDVTHLTGAFCSLLDNAFKYAQGPADITITTKSDSHHISISFADRGIGFGMETKQFIFERFFRAPTGNLHNVKGYGIGLSYVKAIIEAHGGSISVNSTVGEGTEFLLILPFNNGSR